MTPFAFIDPQTIPEREAPAAAQLADNPSRARTPPAWFEALFWTIAWVFAHFVPTLLFSFWTRVSAGNPNVEGYELHLALCGRVLALALGIFLLKARIGSSWKSAINLRCPRLSHCLLAVLCLPAVLALTAALLGLAAASSRSDGPPAEVLQQITANSLWFVILVFAVAPAVNEGVFFRGFMGHVLLRRYGVVLGVLFTSAIFAVAHGNLPQFVLALVFGCFAHAAYLASRSLWVPILLHFVVNASLQTLLHFGAASSDFEATDTQLMALGFGLVIAILASVASGWGLYRLRERQGVPELAA